MSDKSKSSLPLRIIAPPSTASPPFLSWLRPLLLYPLCFTPLFPSIISIDSELSATNINAIDALVHP
ncbi:MAG: hypothetical protein ACI8PB_005007 [Desulforhopalus sp.]|jgi:hypothetical protein